MVIKCPKCGGPVKLFNIQPVGNDEIHLIFLCEKCGAYYEIRVRREKVHEIAPMAISAESDIKELLEKRITPNEIPPDTPYPIKKVVSLKTRAFIPIFLERIFDQPPRTGQEISPNYLKSLGIPDPYATRLAEFWRERGITRLYKFQEEAFKTILSGRHTAIIAPTGTGKTEAFAIPSFVRAIHLKHQRAENPIILIIYPTKALARDQLTKLFKYGEIFGLQVAVLDGDTPLSKRRRILARPPEILLTNFDMIHYHLAKRTKLGYLFRRCRIVIIDELHEYYGAFGTHVHYILKRLRRLAEKEKKKIQVVMSSATIQNPEEFCSLLIDDRVTIVSEKGRKTPLFVLFLYSLDQIHRTAAEILSTAIKERIKSLAFFNTRRSAEFTLYILNRIARREKNIFNKFDLHRAGLPRETRIQIEKDFREGRKYVLIATPTLELGIDIGDIDLVLSEITPVNNFIQRSGRTGRRGRPGSAILLLRNDDPISEYYARCPRDYFEDVSVRYIEPRNPYIASKHVYLAAFEEPLDEEEIVIYNIPREIINDLEREGAVIKIGTKYFANGALFNKYFARNIRGSDKIVRVFYNGRVIDEREAIIAVRELHPGAVYVNRGVKYIVKRLDLNLLKAEVEKAGPDYDDLYTRPLYTYSAVPLGEFTIRETMGTILFHGRMKVTAIVDGYLVFREGQKTPIAEYSLETPVIYEYETYGLVFRAPKLPFTDKELIDGSYHALEHILIEGTSIVTGGGSEDLGGISFGSTGVIVIYEATLGGNGVSRLLFNRFEKAVEKAYKILKYCKCPSNAICNKCVYSYRCGNNNRPLYQPGALMALEKMLKGEKVEDADKALEILLAIEKGIV